MTATPTARLVVAPGDPRTDARVRYAFSAYAALYGIRVVDDHPADVCVAHGDVDEHADVVLPAGYRPRPESQPAPAPSWQDGMPCFHLAPTGEPDVLGEVFEWLAAPHEQACTALDDVGRVPPEHTLAGSHDIDRTIPWANRWLARLHAAVRAALPRLPPTPPSPFGPGRTFVASHDMDHLSADRLVNTRRVARNVGIALVQERRPRTGLQIVGAAAHRIRRRRPVVNGVDDLLAGEAARNVRATYTVVAESTHRRDPGYRLDEPLVRQTLRRIAEDGHELAVHGSYRSLERPGQLAHEFALLAAAGHPATGCRQHWLRHRGAELFTALEGIGAEWDSTRGHPDVVGYRHGAAFPFLPYDLERERPRRLVEIPLVVMERALGRVSDVPEEWPGIAVDVLRGAGADGWGGTAVLWHDVAVPGTTLGRGFAEAYWAVLDAGDRWTTATEVAVATRARWAAAGALPATAARR
ncbi:hypothetical protein [Pseudonocardia sp. KRD291]|uniref:hypothetical protein n=1 Tax=Pseudonocardia sp. KRD291 TaxID=2792007 RepID=UPI001C4A5630|nr:hypothetical protein [Pseudonocardia sp. KRD291]MBW0101556.1 hypothetical protein [Pseudonocardia sp. KRD291]